MILKEMIDLSHIIEDGLITYKGLPAPKICDFWSREYSRNYYEDQSTFHIGKIEMVANTGTYIDAPFHRYEDGEDFSSLSLEKLASIDGILINATEVEDNMVPIDLFKGKDLENKAVLIQTNWSKHWQTDTYFENHPYLSANAANFLVESHVKLVGIDSYNIDDSSSKVRPVHTALLGAGIPIVEHLCNLNKIKGRKFHFSAVPPKIKGLGSFPVRAYAVVE